MNKTNPCTFYILSSLLVVHVYFISVTFLREGRNRPQIDHIYASCPRLFTHVHKINKKNLLKWYEIHIRRYRVWIFGSSVAQYYKLPVSIKNLWVHSCVTIAIEYGVSLWSVFSASIASTARLLTLFLIQWIWWYSEAPACPVETSSGF